MHPSPTADILLYGATGFTGRLVADALRHKGARFSLSGRPSAALDALAAELHVDAFPAALDDERALRESFARARVVLSCAGPFADLGERQQNAALEAGVHLLDISGEPTFLHRSGGRDAEARARGIAFVHSVGFDVVPAEALAWLVSRSLPELELLELAVCYLQGAPSVGTVRSHAQLLAQGVSGLRFHDGAVHAEPLAAHRRVVPFPPPFGARAAVSVPLAEVVLIPRAVACRELRTYSATLAPEALAIAERGLPLYSPERVSRTLEVLEASSRGGPSPAERAACQFAIWARGVDSSGERCMVMTGTDPYGLTAAVAAECAIAAARPDFAARGDLTPTQAFDPQRLLATMAHIGVRWRALS